MTRHGGLVLRGSALRAALLVANVGVAFYMMPFIIHAVGDRWYGMWTLVATFMGYYGYLDFGLSISTQRFIAGAIGRQDNDEVSRLVTTSFTLFLLLGLIGLAITGVIALFGRSFFSDPGEISIFRTVVLILGLNVVFTLVMAPINGLMTGHLRYDIATSIQTGKLVVRTALILYFIGSGYSIIALAVITLLADAGGNVVKIIVARRLFSGVRIRRRYYTPDRLGELFRYGGKSFVNQIAELLRFQIDHLVIAAFVNLSAVTLFNIAGQLVYYFRTLMQALLGVLIPLYARYQAAQDQEAVYRTFYFTSKLAAAGSVLVGGAIIIFGKTFIELWMGRDYTEAYTLVVILTIPTILYITQQSALALMYGLGAVGPLAKVSIIEALSNLGLSVVLVVRYGLAGVALGTAVPLTFYSLFLLVYASRLIGAPLLTYVREVGPVVIVGAALQGATWFVVQQATISGYLDMVMLLLALYPAQALAVLYLAFSRRERRVITETSRRALGIG